MKDSFFTQLYESLTTYPSLKSVFSVYDVLVNFLLPCILMIPIILIYRRTHKGVTYTQTFVHTILIMSVTTSIIMMIIGSNIARAFSLVGALSIIRFRTAVKDGKDTGYIFLSISIGMACGTGMYLVATIFSGLISAMLLLLNTFNVGEKILVDKLLKFRVSEKSVDSKKFEDLMLRYAKDYSLVHSELTNDSGDMQYTYVVTMDKNDKDQEFLKDIRSYNNNKMAAIYYNDQRIEI